MPEKLSRQPAPPQPPAQRVDRVQRAPLFRSRAALTALIHHAPQMIRPRRVPSPVDLGLHLGEAVGAYLGIEVLQVFPIFVVVLLEPRVVWVIGVVGQVLG